MPRTTIEILKRINYVDYNLEPEVLWCDGERDQASGRRIASQLIAERKVLVASLTEIQTHALTIIKDCAIITYNSKDKAMNEQTSHEERAAKALQDINDLAQALQKKNPDLGWEEAQNQAYKQLTNGVKP